MHSDEEGGPTFQKQERDRAAQSTLRRICTFLSTGQIMLRSIPQLSSSDGILQGVEDDDSTDGLEWADERERREFYIKRQMQVGAVEQYGHEHDHSHDHSHDGCSHRSAQSANQNDDSVLEQQTISAGDRV